MRLRRVMQVLALLVVLVVGAVAVIWRMTWAHPAWYRPAAMSDTAAAQLAEAVENRIIEESHKVRQDAAPWTLRVRSEQVNAWLAARLPRWLIHEQDLQWPPQLGTPQVRLTRRGVDLALIISPDHRPRAIVLHILPKVSDERLYLTFDRLSLGRIAMPGYTLDDLIELAGEFGAAEVIQSQELAWVLDLLAGRVSLEPLAVLADDRRVRLIDVTLGDDFIDLKLQTLPPRTGDSSG